LPVSRFDKALGMARRVKRFLSNPEKALTRARIRSKRQELMGIRYEAKSRGREEYKQLKRSIEKINGESFPRSTRWDW
jgi:hypothetical protein